MQDKLLHGEAKASGVTSSENWFFDKAAWLTAEQAAAYLQLKSAKSIRNLVADRRLAHYKLGRFLRFKRADLDAFIEVSRIEGSL
jgi:excisionase family DNA binding protein